MELRLNPFLPFLLLAFSMPIPALACRCLEPDPGRAYRGADAAAVIEVTAGAVSGGPGRATGRLIQSWKSALPSAVTIFSGDDCAYQLASGQRYLLYLRAVQGGAYATRRCWGNLPYAGAAKPLRWLKRYGALSTPPVAP